MESDGMLGKGISSKVFIYKEDVGFHGIAWNRCCMTPSPPGMAVSR